MQVSVSVGPCDQPECASALSSLPPMDQRSRTGTALFHGLISISQHFDNILWRVCVCVCVCVCVLNIQGHVWSACGSWLFLSTIWI
jgi:hypothetical protein